MPAAEARAGIAEKIHNVMDILREYPDTIIEFHCEKILNRLDILAGANMEDYD